VTLTSEAEFKYIKEAVGTSNFGKGRPSQLPDDLGLKDIGKWGAGWTNYFLRRNLMLPDGWVVRSPPEGWKM
jgi:hypothetical protein